VYEEFRLRGTTSERYKYKYKQNINQIF